MIPQITRPHIEQTLEIGAVGLEKGENTLPVTLRFVEGVEDVSVGQHQMTGAYMATYRVRGTHRPSEILLTVNNLGCKVYSNRIKTCQAGEA